NDFVYARRYNAAGAAQGSLLRPDVLFAARDDDNGIYQAVAMDAAGDFVITWDSQGPDGDRDGIFARVYSPAGVPLTSSEGRVNTNVTGKQQAPTVGLDGRGNFVVTWQSSHAVDSNFDVQFQR